jgi:hypothetical protein
MGGSLNCCLARPCMESEGWVSLCLRVFGWEILMLKAIILCVRVYFVSSIFAVYECLLAFFWSTDKPRPHQLPRTWVVGGVV